VKHSYNLSLGSLVSNHWITPGIRTSCNHNSPEAFNKYFLSAAGEIIQDIKNNVKCSNNNEDPKYYISKLFQNSFPNIKFKNTSTKEVERIIRSLRLKNSHGYDGIFTDQQQT
jgi:hypothetical protein